jgi:hypothetical protein
VAAASRRCTRWRRRTSRSLAFLDTSAVAASRSSTLKSSRALAALEGMNLSLYCTRERGENHWLPPGLPAGVRRSAPRSGLPRGVDGCDVDGWLGLNAGGSMSISAILCIGEGVRGGPITSARGGEVCGRGACSRECRAGRSRGAWRCGEMALMQELLRRAPLSAQGALRPQQRGGPQLPQSRCCGKWQSAEAGQGPASASGPPERPQCGPAASPAPIAGLRCLFAPSWVAR